jgi:hypothetical protein
MVTALIGPPFAGMFQAPMPKKASNRGPTRNLPKTPERTPPLLSEKLIAKLQGAVRAAQRKRITESIDARESRSAEKDF